MHRHHFGMAEGEKPRILKTGLRSVMFKGSVQGAYEKVQILTKVWPKNLL